MGALVEQLESLENILRFRYNPHDLVSAGILVVEQACWYHSEGLVPLQGLSLFTPLKSLKVVSPSSVVWSTTTNQRSRAARKCRPVVCNAETP